MVGNPPSHPALPQSRALRRRRQPSGPDQLAAAVFPARLRMKAIFLIQIAFIVIAAVLAILNRRRFGQRPRYGVDVPPPPSRVCRKFPLWAFVPAGIFFALGLVWLANTVWRIRYSVKTTGVILLVQHRLDNNRPGKIQTMHTPILRTTH